MVAFRPGILIVDATRVTCDAQVEMALVDCDLNLDDELIEVVGVPVVSASEPVGESVSLTEIAPFLGNFEGVLSLSTVDAPGVLLVSHGGDGHGCLRRCRRRARWR